MTHLSQAAFAARLGVRRSYVTRLKQEGRLVMSADGQWVDVEASQARIAETADPGKVAVAERHAAARGAAVGDKTPPKTDADGDGEPAAGTPDYQKARARREEANASMAEMELAERAGQLMETAAVRAAGADAGATCRGTLETMGAILAPQLATLGDENAIRKLVDEYVAMALDELCDRLAGLPRGVQS